jgi:hypothetical protein
VYEDPESYAEEVAGYANLLREDAGRTKFPYPIYPDAGGVLPRSGDDPDRWPVVVCDSHLLSWEAYQLGTAEFLTAVLTLPSPIEPLAYIAETSQPPRFVSRSGETLVTAAHMTGVQVDLSVEDAAAFYHGLGRLLGLE